MLTVAGADDGAGVASTQILPRSSLSVYVMGALYGWAEVLMSVLLLWMGVLVGVLMLWARVMMVDTLLVWTEMNMYPFGLYFIGVTSWL